MQQKILSVGIDIGTSTTQIIFSEISIQNTAASYLMPEIKITDKKIVYKSKIYFTPLISREKIDLEKIKKIILMEYEKAGVDKSSISTGAIIITGETARKENAEEVLSAVSDFSGDFVAAAAGPDLESILAGFGAGAAEESKNRTAKVVNFDIGGGTTNAAVFSDGDVSDSYALDIGGRLIQFDSSGIITYVSSKIKHVISALKLNIFVGAAPKFEELKLLTDTFASFFIQIYKNKPMNCEIKKLFINHQNKAVTSDYIMFSGGVSEYIYNTCEISSVKDVIRFGDIGPLLGYSIRKLCEKNNLRLLTAKEKIRATVIGTGSNSIKISGSTIVFDEDILPLKNIPIIKLFNSNENFENMYNIICEKTNYYIGNYTAISFKGPKSPSYFQIKAMAQSIADAYVNSSNPIIIIVENDFAKALGQTIKTIIGNSKKLICLDRIKVDTGDYIDIGKPVSNVIPVVVKTLIFNR